MKYGDLIQFEALETVIQLRDADKSAQSKTLVDSFVISDDMADRIINIIFAQLQFDEPRDNKGLLVVGNYGTGKSHLMAVVSALAEHADLVPAIHNDQVAAASAQIAGKFKVKRTEIGSTTRSLRDIIISTLEEYLEEIGVSYKFPSADSLNNHKKAFEEMMAAFGSEYPEQGLLLVVDELLDYLRSRNQQALIYDLNFLREVGEVCKDLRFRFMAGVQEAIFDSTIFSFTADSIRRVRDRFEQVSIIKDDVVFVVSERLLKKDAAQLAWIREHLSKFAGYYSSLNPQLEKFSRLFPIHPDYIETFENLKGVEKREILKTLSIQMRALLDKEVPEDAPGFIAFDSYWTILCSNPSFRTIPDVKAVMDCSKVLEERVNTALNPPRFRPQAARIIAGLSVHRLTVSDIYAPVGASAAELCNRLALFDKDAVTLGGDEPDKDLLTHIEHILGEIYKTVNGQFISHNKDNDQYYLDLKKTDDYESLIKARAATLSDSQLDECLFQVLAIVMECPAATYRSGFKIWVHDLLWFSHNASRRGYLFFGTPNERSTTIPQYDFYLYFLECFEPASCKTEKKPDEVFFEFKNIDEEFSSNLRLFGGAMRLAETAQGETKRVYQKYAGDYLKTLAEYLRKNVGTVFDLTYQGQKKSVSDWIARIDLRRLTGICPNETLNFRDFINAVAEVRLESHFANIAPEYPKFAISITEGNRAQAAKDALLAIAGIKRTKQAEAVLDALELLDGDRVTPRQSRYAAYILDLKQHKGDAVLNRGEVLIEKDSRAFLAPERFRLEPELTLVVIAALVAAGDVVLAVAGNKFDAGKLPHLARCDWDLLLAFKHLESAKGYNLPALKALFALAGLPEGKATLAAQGNEESVADLQQNIMRIIERIVKTQNRLNSGIVFWIFDLAALHDFSAEKDLLREAKTFFEGLQAYNSPGKLKNLKAGIQDIAHFENIEQVLRLFDALQNIAVDNSGMVGYLQEAGHVFRRLEAGVESAGATVQPASSGLKKNDWVYALENAKREIEDALRTLTPVNADTLYTYGREITARLRKLKAEYIVLYTAQHSKARLNTHQAARKEKLLADGRLAALATLTLINIMPQKQIAAFKTNLQNLVPCGLLTQGDMDKYAVCPHCGYIPGKDGVADSGKSIESACDELDALAAQWTQNLLNNLKDSSVVNNLALLSTKEKERIDAFIAAKELPAPTDTAFFTALKSAFSSLERVSITVDDVLRVLRGADGPLTPGELRQNLDSFIESLISGKDPTKIRIVVEG